jgi:glucan phosphoethanolaminetransferase (alkaline phosphatase superfamily)
MIMKHFQSIEKLDTGNLYVLELTSSLSVLLLAFGLIASIANVLTKGSVLTDSIIMQRIWAWTQCVAIDASVAGIIIRIFRSHTEGERLKIWLYGFLSVLLLFTAAIVSNIESVQKTLSIALDRPYLHVFVPLEALI